MDIKLLKESRERIVAGTRTLISVENILKTDFGPELWTVDQLIPQKSITAITGVPGSFKTWLTLDIARCISRGIDFLDQFKTNKGKVLVIDKENHLQHIQKRLKMLNVRDDPIFYIEKVDDFLIDDQKSFAIIADMVKEMKIELVIFDSLVRIHSGDENESKDISKAMNLFRKITRMGSTVVFIHHNRKEKANTQSSTNSVRGSSDILAGIDCLIQISKPTKNQIRVAQSKLRQGEEIEPFNINIVISEDKSQMKFEYAGNVMPDSNASNEILEEILNLLKDGAEKTRQELIKMLPEEYTALTIDEALKILLTTNKIDKKVGAHNKFFFTLKKDIASEKGAQL